MSRRPTILQGEYPYSIGGRCINREWFSLPMEQVWEIMSEQLYFMHMAYKVEILVFVLMSNHFHLIARTPLANLSVAMGTFMRESSRAIVKAAYRINQTYGQRHFRSIIERHQYYLHAYKYFYYNPVHAGLCARAEDYPYSTLRGLLGFERLLIPVSEDVTLFSDVEGTLNWLNRAPAKSGWESVRRALRKEKFALAKDRSTHQQNRLEIDML